MPSGRAIAVGVVLASAVLGCGGAEERPVSRPAQVETAGRQAPPSGPAPSIGSVRVNPANPTRATSLRAVVELSGPAGSDGRRISYQWIRGGKPIEGRTERTLPADVLRKGDEISVRVTANGKAAESSSVRVGNAPPKTVMAWIVPEIATRNADLEARARGFDLDDDKLTFRYRWFRSGEELKDAGGERLPSREFRKKDRISVEVIPSDSEAEGASLRSSPVEIRNAQPHITSQPPAQVSGGVYQYQVAAKDPDEDKLTFNLGKAPAGMTIDGKGAITWAIGGGGSGTHAVEVVVTDQDGAKATQAFTVTVSVSEKQP